MNHPRIRFRKPNCSSELEQLLKLRQTVYSSEQRLAGLSDNEFPLISPFDLRSAFYGGFLEEKACAVIRIVLPVGRFQNDLLLQLDSSAPRQDDYFPFQRYTGYEKWSEDFLKNLAPQHGEVGHLAIAKAYRNTPNLLEELFHHFINYCQSELKIETGFGSCPLALERIYLKMGFQRVKGCTPFTYLDLPPAVLMRFDSPTKSI